MPALVEMTASGRRLSCAPQEKSVAAFASGGERWLLARGTPGLRSARRTVHNWLYRACGSDCAGTVRTPVGGRQQTAGVFQVEPGNTPSPAGETIRHTTVLRRHCRSAVSDLAGQPRVFEDKGTNCPVRKRPDIPGLAPSRPIADPRSWEGCREQSRGKSTTRRVGFDSRNGNHTRADH